MAENFEISKLHDAKEGFGNLFNEVMRDTVQKPEAGRSEAQIALMTLDGPNRRMFNAVLESMSSISERLQSLPESVRSEFFAGIDKMHGPAYDLIRNV